jgi:hypothetical protein
MGSWKKTVYTKTENTVSTYQSLYRASFGTNSVRIITIIVYTAKVKMSGTEEPCRTWVNKTFAAPQNLIKTKREKPWVTMIKKKLITMPVRCVKLLILQSSLISHIELQKKVKTSRAVIYLTISLSWSRRIYHKFTTYRFLSNSMKSKDSLKKKRRKFWLSMKLGMTKTNI